MKTDLSRTWWATAQGPTKEGSFTWDTQTEAASARGAARRALQSIESASTTAVPGIYRVQVKRARGQKWYAFRGEIKGTCENGTRTVRILGATVLKTEPR